MSKNLSALVLSLLFALVSGVSTGVEHPNRGGEHPSASTAEDAKVLGVLFYADWCPTCKVLEPKLDAVKPEFENTIQFVRLDMTDDESKAGATQTADELGIAEVLRAHDGKTGFMVLVDKNSGKPLQTLTAEMDTGALRTSMNAAISGGGSSEHPKSEHPKAEHPKSEHPTSGKKAEHPGKQEHPSEK